MTNEWQFIHHADGKVELVRWKSDPGEHLDLSSIPEDRPTLEVLRATLENLTRHSLEPWLALGYLLALDRPGISFLSQCTLADRMRTNPSALPRRVGTSQAYFALDSSVAPRPTPPDEELLKSLPYQ